MTDPTASVVARIDGDLVLIVVSGEIDLANADNIEQQLAGAIPNTIVAAAVDLSDVTYIDSVGMRILFSLAARLDTAQIALRFRAPIGSPARRVLEVSGLTSVVEVDPPA